MGEKKREDIIKILRWVVCWKFNNDRPLQSWMDFWWQKHPRSRLHDLLIQYDLKKKSLEVWMFVMEVRRGRPLVAQFCQRSMLQPQPFCWYQLHGVENNRLEADLLLFPWCSWGCSSSLGCCQCGKRSTWNLWNLRTLQSELWLSSASWYTLWFRVIAERTRLL